MIAVRLIILFVFGVIAAAGLVDIVLEARAATPLGYLLPRWARRYPLYSALLVVLLGALLGHFFLHVPCSPANCS